MLIFITINANTMLSNIVSSNVCIILQKLVITTNILFVYHKVSKFVNTYQLRL